MATIEKTLPARMSHQEAAKVLRAYNWYRRGYHEPCDPPYSGKVIGEAIDVAIAALEPRIVPTLDNIIQAVTRETGVTEDELFGRKRHREYAYARFLVYWLAYKYTDKTLTAISRRMQRIDHVIVIYGIKKGEEWMENPILNPVWVGWANNIIKSFCVDDKD